MQENYIVGIYARLSRDDERAGESVSIENQKEMLSRYVREQGWTLYDYYCDDGVSGTTFDRPGLNRLVQDATDHKINLALCKDLSRLGRDYIEAGKYTDFVFPSLGCRFIALNDGVDSLRKNNEMLVILKNVMNDLYARDTSSKIKAVKLSMLNQAAGDRKILAERLNISSEQLAYVTNSEPGHGLLFFNNVILPFADDFPKDTELYKLLTTKPSEVAHETVDDEKEDQNG